VVASAPAAAEEWRGVRKTGDYAKLIFVCVAGRIGRGEWLDS